MKDDICRLLANFFAVMVGLFIAFSLTRDAEQALLICVLSLLIDARSKGTAE